MDEQRKDLISDLELVKRRVSRLDGFGEEAETIDSAISLLKAREPDKRKYEYHTDHTDCVWYTPDEESKCPVTCSQYRDGWNDAMDYIYKGGNGYRPYKRR